MLNKNAIIELLTNKGYKVEEKEVTKNGVILSGITFLSDSNVNPVIYLDEIIKEANKKGIDLETAANEIIKIYEKNKGYNVDIEAILKENYILKNVFVGLQKESKEEIEKRICKDLKGIEEYLYIRIEANNDSFSSMKVTSQLVSNLEIPKSELWESAIANTCKESTLTSLAETIAELSGMPLNEELESQIPFYVLTNASKIKGASAILNRSLLREFASKKNVDKIVVLPSSIHETLIAAYTDDLDISELSDMVKCVNSEQVDPTEQLTNQAYIITI